MEQNVGYNHIYKNKRLMKSHLAIDSRNRNKNVNSYKKSYSDPNDYQITINKYKKFKNVISVRLIEAMIPNTQFIINNNNKWINIILPSETTETYISLDVGNYTFSTLGQEIEDKLNAEVFPLTPFTVTLNNVDTFTTKIECSSGNFTLLFLTGRDSDCSVSEVFGFEKEDIISSLNPSSGNHEVISQYPYHLNSSKYVDLKIDEIPDLGTTIDIKDNIQKQILKRIPLNVDFSKEQYYKATDSDRFYNYFSPIELSNLNIKLYSDNGKIYDSNRIDNYMILEIVMLQDEAPDNIGFHPILNSDNESNTTIIQNDIKNIDNSKKEITIDNNENIINSNENIIDNNKDIDNNENIIDNNENIIDNNEKFTSITSIQDNIENDNFTSIDNIIDDEDDIDLNIKDFSIENMNIKTFKKLIKNNELTVIVILISFILFLIIKLIQK